MERSSERRRTKRDGAESEHPDRGETKRERGAEVERERRGETMAERSREKETVSQ